MATDYTIYGEYFVPAILLAHAGGLIGGPNVNVYSNVTLTPLVTGNAILDKFTLPANAMANKANSLYIIALATTAANANSKTLAINIGGTGAVGVAPTGGATVATTVTAVASESLIVEAQWFKTGSSTQTYMSLNQQHGVTFTAPTTGTQTLTDTAPIQINLLVNDATTAGDATVVYWCVCYQP